MIPLPFLLISFLLLAACGGAAPTDLCQPSTGGIVLRPTATRPSDPDLMLPPQLPPAGGGADCGTAAPTIDATPPTQFMTTGVTNLSLDMEDQALAATAVGDDMLAVAWITTNAAGDSDIYVALARGGNHFQVRRLDRGQDVSLTFSRANRLHVAYEQDGRILYRAADQGAHPADVDPLFVEIGRTPQVVVDALNWAHVLFEQDGSIYKAKHLSGDAWLTQFVAYGVNPVAKPFYNEKELVLWGMPTGTVWFGIMMAAPYDGQMRVFRFLSWFNVWEQVAAFPLATDEILQGRAGLDFRVVDRDEAWVYAAWMTRRPAAAATSPPFTPPAFAAANPLFPQQLANPDAVHAGLNAARWGSAATPFDAGLQQTTPVKDTTRPLTFSAWGRAELSTAEVALRIGIDPTGGEQPDGASVVWSDVVTATTFTRLSVTVPAQADTATLFLRATQPESGAAAAALWDSAALENGRGLNLDFEAAFDPQPDGTVPTAWTAWYQDSALAATGTRVTDTLYAAWSQDGGGAWVGPEAVSANLTLGGGASGALGGDVTPLIALTTDPPSVNFFYIYESGDPPPHTTFLRFGRPFQTQCELGATTCTDAPGMPLLPRSVVRPSVRLLAAPDPFKPDRALLAWDARQTDIVNKDVYASYLALR